MVLIVAHATVQATSGRGKPAVGDDVTKHIHQYVDLLVAAGKLRSSDKVSPEAKAEIARLEREAEKKFQSISLDLGHAVETAVGLSRAVYYGTMAVAGIADFIADPELHQALDDMNKGFAQMDAALNGMNAGVKQVNSGLAQANKGIAKANKGMDELNEGIAQANRGMDQANEGVAKANKAMAAVNKAVPGIAAGAQKLRELPSFKDLDLSALKDITSGVSPLEDKVIQAKASALLDLVPGIGDGKGIIEAITGKGMATGERLTPTDRLLGSVVLLRWMKAGKGLIKADELTDAMKAEKATGKIDGWMAREAYDKVPASLKDFEQLNNKGIGYRWNDGKGNGVRIDQGERPRVTYSLGRVAEVEGVEQAVTVERVKLPEMRAEIISALRALSDTGYQKRVWIDRDYPHPDYYDDFTLNVNVLYDDTTVLADPEAALGYTLTSEAEVRVMKTLADVLGNTLSQVGREATDAEFLASPCWPQVVATATRALSVLTGSSSDAGTSLA
ncbi:SCO4402 family protein [Streptomyces sp. NPDC055287]